MIPQVTTQNNQNEAIITLKEITDLLEVRHNDAMTKITKLAEEPSFGVLRKTRITHENGGRPTDTYQLNKKQAIAVGAKLNNALLMKLIDKLEELESKNQKPMSIEEILKLTQNTIEQLESKNLVLVEQNQIMQPKALFADSVAQSHTSILIGQFAKAISSDTFNIGQNRLFAWLRDNKYLMQGGTQHNQPMQRYIDNKYFETTERTINNPDGSTRITITTKITGKGQVALAQKIINSLEEVAA